MNWIEESRPISTRKTYDRYFKEYVNYAKEKGLNHRSPVALASFMKYAVTTRPRTLGRDTVTNIIPASVASGFRYTDPSLLQSKLVSEMKNAVKRKVPKESRAKAPLSPDILRDIARNVTTWDLENTRNYFMVLLMTLAMLRESEAVNITMDDIWIEEEGSKSLHVSIPWSKTDQAGDGQVVLLSEMDDFMLCPLIWFDRYCGFRDESQNYLFYSLGKIPGPLSEKTPNHIVKKLVRGIGLDDRDFGSHSCRRGGCTAAIEAGTDLRTVARHGRWRSSAINTYIVDSRDTQLSVSKSIVDS